MNKSNGIGAVLREERTSRGWTQEKLAELAGIGVRTVQRIETEGVISHRNLRAIADALETEPHDLLRKAKSASSPATDSSRQVEILPKLTTGRDLASVIGGVEMSSFDHDELDSQDEVDLVAGFLQELQDLGDLWNDLEAGHRVEFTFELQERLKTLTSSGFSVYGKRTHRLFQFGGELESIKMSVAIILVLRHGNPKIVQTEMGDFVSAVS